LGSCSCSFKYRTCRSDWSNKTPVPASVGHLIGLAMPFNQNLIGSSDECIIGSVHMWTDFVTRCTHFLGSAKYKILENIYNSGAYEGRTHDMHIKSLIQCHCVVCSTWENHRFYYTSFIHFFSVVWVRILYFYFLLIF